MQLRAEEISSIIKKQIQNYEKAALTTETGMQGRRKQLPVGGISLDSIHRTELESHCPCGE